MTLFLTGRVPNARDPDVSAPHVGFAQFLLGDGAVRPIGESIGSAEYRALGTRAGAN